MSTQAILPAGFTLDNPPKLPPGMTLDATDGLVPVITGSSQPSAPPQGFGPGNAVKRFTGNFGQAIGVPERMSDYVEGPAYALSHPMDSAKLVNDAATSAQQSTWEKAKQAWNTPESAEGKLPGFGWWPSNKVRGMAYGLYSAIPFVGPQLAKAGEQLERGDIAGAMGTTGGIGTMTAGPKIPEMAGNVRGGIAAAMSKARAPLGETMMTPRGTTPAESATPAELQEYAKDNNIPVNAAQVTEHNLPRNLQKAGERATVGGTAVKRQVSDAQAAIAGHVDDLMNKMSPSSQTPTTAESGQTLKANIQQALDRQQQAIQNNFDGVDQQANGVQVDLRPVKQLAQGILDQSGWLRDNLKTTDPTRAAKLLRDITQMQDSASFKNAQGVRSRLIQEGLEPENAINSEAQGWIKRLSGATDDAMMDGATGKPGLEASFRMANMQWQNLQKDFNSPRSPLYQALVEPLPEKVPQKFLQKGSTGGSPTTIDMLDRYGIDKGPLKRELLSDLAETGFRTDARKKLGGYDDDFLGRLYSPEELDHVYKTGALARSVEMRSNPSGTSDVMSAREQASRPIRSLLFDTGPAKLTMSPRFNQWLMNAPLGRPGALTAPQFQALERGQVAAAAAAAAKKGDYDEAQRYLRSLP